MMTQPPSLRQLRYLVALAETGHFRKAAERCGISQPSLSVQIGNLEERLGITLVSRGRGPVSMTVAGREVLARARHISDEVTALADLSTALQTGLAGTVKLGTSTTLGPYFLPHVVGSLHDDHPDLKLYIREDSPRALIDDLARGQHDLILTQLPVAGADFNIARLFREPLYLAVARDHPLAERESIKEEEIAGLQILSLGASYVLHEQILALGQRYGAHVVRDYEGTSLDALRAMAAMGMGVAFLPALYVASEIGRTDGPVRVLRFERNRITRSVGLVARRNSGSDQTLGHLAQIFREVARNQSNKGLTLES